MSGYFNNPNSELIKISKLKFKHASSRMGLAKTIYLWAGRLAEVSRPDPHTWVRIMRSLDTL